MRTERVVYLSEDGETELDGYLATPDGPGPYPVVLILRGVAGPESGYIEIAERIAGWGYLAFLHGWKVRGDDPADGPIKADLTGVMAYLTVRADVDAKRMAVFGFCRGGVHALMLAAAHVEIRLIVIFHGFAFRPDRARPGLQPFDLIQAISVPTLIQHGTEDEQAPVAGMRRLEACVASVQPRVSFRYYEGARHGFAVRTHPGFDGPAAELSFMRAHALIQSELT